MKEESRDWKKVSDLNEVQVFRNGDLIESYSGEELSVELFDTNPEDSQ